MVSSNGAPAMARGCRARARPETASQTLRAHEAATARRRHGPRAHEAVVCARETGGGRGELARWLPCPVAEHVARSRVAHHGSFARPRPMDSAARGRRVRSFRRGPTARLRRFHRSPEHNPVHDGQNCVSLSLANTNLNLAQRHRARRRGRSKEEAKHGPGKRAALCNPGMAAARFGLRS